MVPWKVVEHTADVGIEAWGDTWEEAIVALIEGFTALVCPDGEVRAVEARTVEVSAARWDDLLVDLLDEINYIHQTDGFIPASSKVVVRAEPKHVRAEISGERYDEKRHGHLMEIKAVTYHEMQVDAERPRVKVIVDI